MVGILLSLWSRRLDWIIDRSIASCSTSVIVKYNITDYKYCVFVTMYGIVAHYVLVVFVLHIQRFGRCVPLLQYKQRDNDVVKPSQAVRYRIAHNESGY